MARSTGTSYLIYIKKCLAPKLNRGDIVIMDNPPAHKVAGGVQAIEAKNATALHLPA
jgi:hypothetical protein